MTPAANPYPGGTHSPAYWRKWDRCVKSVRKRGGAANPYAVCHKSIQRTTNPFPPREVKSSADPWVALGVFAVGVGAFVWLVKAL